MIDLLTEEWNNTEYLSTQDAKGCRNNNNNNKFNVSFVPQGGCQGRRYHYISNPMLKWLNTPHSSL